MPYDIEISRNQPSCFLFLIDQSSSMEEQIPAIGKSKAQFVADVLNKTLYQLVIRCSRAEGVRNYFEIGILAYGGDSVRSGFGGGLSAGIMHPLSAVADHPLRVATCNRKHLNLQSSPFSDRNYLQLKGVQTGIICN